MPFRENAPDKRVHFLRLLRRRGASGANGPDRFVSNDDTVEVRGCQPAEASDYLLADYILGLTTFSLLKRLADTYDHPQPGSDARLSFATDQVIVLQIVLSSLGVPDDHMRATSVPKHEGRDLARECPFAPFSRAILRSNFDVRAFQTIGDGLKRCENCSDYYVAMGCICN